MQLVFRIHYLVQEERLGGDNWLYKVVAGHFAERHFAERHLAERHFACLCSG